MLDAAGERLQAAGVTLAGPSPVYETHPRADEPQPAYLNAVLRAETAMPARELLDVCLGIEQALGRRRPPGRAKAARTIDIDLLLYGAAIIEEVGTLSVPHPGLLERAFVR